ncbi:restriction endonuclease subunit S [Streptomyces microflavus]|uniref:restriction endonuclease subunit S n=1 Tax=Streptomyces microflavus TaxID=1919 RepID=UPI0038176FE6
MSADLGWETAPLRSRLVRVDAGRSPDLSDVPAGAGEWGVLKVSAVHTDGFRPSENKATGLASALIEPRYEVHPGDLLFSRANTPELVGSACLVTDTSERLMLSDKTLRLVLDPGSADSRFVNICLASPSLRRQIGLASSGSSRSMQNISQRAIEKLILNWPSLDEQRRIVEVLDAVQESERATQAVIGKLRVLRLNAVSAEFSTLAEIGNSVQIRWVPVKEAGSVRMGKQLSPEGRSSPGQHPYLRVANVLDDRIDYSDVKSMGFTNSERQVYSLHPGDILLNEGQSLELVGRSAIYEQEAGKFCFQNTLVRFRPGDGLLSRYAQAVFDDWLRTGKFAQIAKQTTSIAHLGGERFGALQFPLLPVDEQRRIVELLEFWDARISSEESALRKLRDLKRGLMGDLLAGTVLVGERDQGSVVSLGK